MYPDISVGGCTSIMEINVKVHNTWSSMEKSMLSNISVDESIMERLSLTLVFLISSLM